MFSTTNLRSLAGVANHQERGDLIAQAAAEIDRLQGSPPHNRAQAIQRAIADWNLLHDLRATEYEKHDLFENIVALWGEQQISDKTDEEFQASLKAAD